MNQKMDFVCKYCNKRYPCGKSLGGHLSSHKTGDGFAGEDGRHCNDRGVKELRVEGNSGLCLHMNWKDMRLFEDSGSIMRVGNVCKECGKGFQSLKALCGHMACHSEKEKATNHRKDVLEYSEKQILEMDVVPDSEASAQIQRRRSKRIKCRVPAKILVSGSSSVSEIEQEQEEVAKCLMLLSRDTSNFKGAWTWIRDGADHDSDYLEAKSSSSDVRSGKSGEIDVSNSYGSGYVKKRESDCYVDDNISIRELKNRKLVYGSKAREDGVEWRKWLNRIKHEAEGVEGTIREAVDVSRKRVENDMQRSFSDWKNGSVIGEKISESPKKLAKHKDCQKKLKMSTWSKYERSKTGSEIDTSHNPSQVISDPELFTGGNATRKEKKPGTKKKNRHECPICFRVFRSGQALGGHKRSHFLGRSKDKAMVTGRQVHEVPALIDLNLPAWEEENGEAGLLSW
ncbi:uncharacterized protein LOC115671729 [Syzygium oleosum]|uniref:uncharacterized protein LOC115671729 n=1 Tax=Syzygium oleosum TaxID=219896 RepID=UPI0011D1A455|nr:uncharacterized protein LOC115671729 [Syzygium oleosum]XP_056165211.1 uncharacterized protein LOC115671729 [Syzygium oleosum]